jgi:hypothetical protein
MHECVKIIIHVLLGALYCVINKHRYVYIAAALPWASFTVTKSYGERAVGSTNNNASRRDVSRVISHVRIAKDCTKSVKLRVLTYVHKNLIRRGKKVLRGRKTFCWNEVARKLRLHRFGVRQKNCFYTSSNMVSPPWVRCCEITIENFSLMIPGRAQKRR